jgi:tRNA threonylcarbamoyladenosine biosynthesis protein TsaE
VSGEAWLTYSGEETEALGGRLLTQAWSASPRAQAPLVVELSGDLGTGKSTFARGVLRAFGATGHLKSPTYTLLEAYELPADTPTLTVVHLDLYRLIDPAELEHLGLADYHRPGFLWLVEWPGKAAGRLPRADLRFEFSMAEGAHRIQRIETFSANK